MNCLVTGKECYRENSKGQKVKDKDLCDCPRCVAARERLAIADHNVMVWNAERNAKKMVN